MLRTACGTRPHPRVGAGRDGTHAGGRDGMDTYGAGRAVKMAVKVADVGVAARVVASGEGREACEAEGPR